MIELPDPPTDKEVTDINVSNNNKIIKQISKLEFENDVINELMEMFDIKQK